MAVVFYHVGFTTFGGGFVGVDVFFVLSGYLITALIMREVKDTGTFSFGSFYLCRIRRLFPALLSTLIFTWIGAFPFFSPDKLSQFGASLISAVFSLSNFYFWSSADDFDAAAITKPLLHTWSLSLEEQFYLIWPAFAVLVLAKLRPPVALAAIGAICVASFTFAETWLATDSNGAFYLCRPVWVNSQLVLPWFSRTRNGICRTGRARSVYSQDWP